MEKNIEIKIEDLKDMIKSKYFIVTLSNEKNLVKCIENKIAGFPETDNGRWAFLDVEVDDYMSFYYNGRLYNLYRVKRKFIPEMYQYEEGRGNENFDPEPLGPTGDRWLSIGRSGNRIYFPYRLELEIIKEIDLSTSIIFKRGLERLGINLIPRISFKKTHFQLTIKDMVELKLLDTVPTVKSKKLNIGQFLDFFAKVHRVQVLNQLGMVMSKEVFLQVVIKRFLEASRSKWLKIMDEGMSIDEMEFLSEQTVYGGESDIVITNKNNNFMFIEVKNRPILNQRNQFTREGKEAYNQVMKYRDLLNPNRSTLKSIAGKTNFTQTDIVMRIGKLNQVYTIEINVNFRLT